MIAMLNKILVLVIFFSIYGIINSYSQQAEIVFQESTYDFGQIEEGVVAAHQFIFKNGGDRPLVISGVKASCGCTTPNWSKQPVMPGEEGYVKASYNSKNRPGGFHKSITITSNAASPSKIVYIKGVVIKEKSFEPLFTAEELENAPRAEIIKQHLQLGKVQIGSNLPIKLSVQNKGKRPLEIKGIYSSCQCVSIMPGKNLVVEPESEGLLELVYTPRSIGEFTHGAYVLSNDLIQPKYQIYLTSTAIAQQSKSSLVKEAPSKISF